jgi:hypothetical protein
MEITFGSIKEQILKLEPSGNKPAEAIKYVDDHLEAVKARVEFLHAQRAIYHEGLVPPVQVLLPASYPLHHIVEQAIRSLLNDENSVLSSTDKTTKAFAPGLEYRGIELKNSSIRVDNSAWAYLNENQARFIEILMQKAIDFDYKAEGNGHACKTDFPVNIFGSYSAAQVKNSLPDLIKNEIDSQTGTGKGYSLKRFSAPQETINL